MYPTGKGPHFLFQRSKPPRHHSTPTQHLTVYDWDPGDNHTSLFSVTRGHVTSFYENESYMILLSKND